MSRKHGIITFLFLASVFAAAAPSYALGREQHVTMIVVPARYSVLQVAFDIVEHEEAILLSYQGSADTPYPALHAWNGREWVFISLEDYADANFLQVLPDQVILVGDEASLPSVLVDASSWCQLVMGIPSIDTATLVNSFGKVFSFRSADWMWFSQRYNLDMVDLNADERGVSWYDQPGPKSGEVKEKYKAKDIFQRDKRSLFEEEPSTSIDLQKPFDEAVEPIPMDEPVSMEPPAIFEDERPAPRRAAKRPQPEEYKPPRMNVSEQPSEWEERAVATDVY